MRAETQTGWCGSTKPHDGHPYEDPADGSPWYCPGYRPVKR